MCKELLSSQIQVRKHSRFHNRELEIKSKDCKKATHIMMVMVKVQIKNLRSIQYQSLIFPQNDIEIVNL